MTTVVRTITKEYNAAEVGRGWWVLEDGAWWKVAEASDLPDGGTVLDLRNGREFDTRLYGPNDVLTVWEGDDAIDVNDEPKRVKVTSVSKGQQVAFITHDTKQVWVSKTKTRTERVEKRSAFQRVVFKRTVKGFTTLHVVNAVGKVHKKTLSNGSLVYIKG